jgi:hypothetical protein
MTDDNRLDMVQLPVAQLLQEDQPVEIPNGVKNWTRPDLKPLCVPKIEEFLLVLWPDIY